MNSKNSTNGTLKRILKVLLSGVIILIPILFTVYFIRVGSSCGIIISLIPIPFIVHLIWVSSGSNQWKLVKDENGIKIWTIKTPGNSMIKCKANLRVQSTLGGLIKLIEDTSSWADLGMDSSKIILMDTMHAPGYYSGYMGFKQDMPFPFTDREIITLMQRFQNPQSKKIEINVMATPNKLPPSEGYVRIEHMHNSYTFTPLENGEVEVDFRNEFDLGGFVPYFIKNLSAPGMLYKMMFNLIEMLKKEKYKNARLDHIKEINEK